MTLRPEPPLVKIATASAPAETFSVIIRLTSRRAEEPPAAIFIALRAITRCASAHGLHCRGQHAGRFLLAFFCGCRLARFFRLASHPEAPLFLEFLPWHDSGAVASGRELFPTCVRHVL